MDNNTEKVKNDRFRNKYLAIQKAFRLLYYEQGLRTELIIKVLEREFFLSANRIQEILRMDLNEK